MLQQTKNKKIKTQAVYKYYYKIEITLKVLEFVNEENYEISTHDSVILSHIDMAIDKLSLYC